jgi:hypothetical protein
MNDDYYLSDAQREESSIHPMNNASFHYDRQTREQQQQQQQQQQNS